MLLNVESVSHIYNEGKPNRCVAVNNVSLQVGEKDFLCLTGKSGCGKSTLFHMICGLLPPTKGKILFQDNDIWRQDEAQLALMRNAQIGYIQQGSGLLANYTAFDNVRLPFFLHKREGDGAERAAMLLERVGLANKAENYPAELSGGEQKRVAIVRALMNDPVMLVADEPTADIDEESTHEVMRFFSELAQEGMAVLVATHDMDILSYANRVFKMKAGEIGEE
ncbi:ABC transporter ATP-binding protein [Christensenellaceae bacterium OttesenSCG-928-K19]|nr:ABC transporter ATP-binding protein [Christensenellaceae bacterium OttesenSCG-928-K19]